MKLVWIKLNILNSQRGVGEGGGKPPETLENLYVTSNENYHWKFIIFPFFPSFFLWFFPLLILQQDFGVGTQALSASPLRTPLLISLEVCFNKCAIIGGKNQHFLFKFMGHFDWALPFFSIFWWLKFLFGNKNPDYGRYYYNPHYMGYGRLR